MGTDTEAELVRIRLCEPERFELYEMAKATANTKFKAAIDDPAVAPRAYNIAPRRRLQSVGWFDSQDNELDVLIILFALWAYHDMGIEP